MSAAIEADRLGERYELHELLGRGGMAEVHRATDRVLGRQVALKQLTVDITASDRSHLAVLFEREFHTLAQLSHPHVIAVFDYGLGPAGAPYYTMELLDGGDLRERPPLPWREACRLVFDVCSALALVHSRRLLHRDITPRNIRCTQAGIAKLIDFGAMSPMTAGGSEVVGTPAFTAPETLQRLALDARTDLYSLGVTLYYALTARLPYNARTFADLLAAWAIKPIVPSALVPEIPAALDDLVLALVSVEPALRPASASEVMQRLAACAGLRLEESDSVSRAYLSTPTLVGRVEVLAELRDALRDSRLRRAASVLIRATPGGGRSRLLDACALEAATLGVTVSRATVTGTREGFAAAQRLVNHLLDTLPRAAELAAVPELFATPSAANDDQARPILRDLRDLEAGRAQKLLRRFILGVSRTYPLLLAIDDVHKIDEPSAALLAELIDSTRRGGILVALTTDSEAPETEALQALARRCRVLELAPLSRAQTRELLDSLFGDVANLDLLTDEIHRVALGNPRQTLELAQHLVDRGLIRYTSGSWTLPSRWSENDLPRSATVALQARIAGFSELARVLSEAQALAFQEEFSDDDYRALAPSASSRDLDLALSELLEAGAVLRDGAVYRLANRAWSAAFLADLDPEQTQLRHRALADMYAAKQHFGQLHHAFAAGLDERGLEILDRRNVARTESDMQKIVERDGGRLVWCYPRAIETAKRLGHSPRRVHDLRRWQYLGSLVTRNPPDRASAQIWLDQLTHDSGLDLYRGDTQSATPQARLTSALQRAYARYLATPEAERVYPVDEAIRKLGEYVVIGVVEAARALDSELIHGLPDLVEPFTALSPLLEAIWLNLAGARVAYCYCDFERARELWLATLRKLETIGDSAQEVFVSGMRNAVIFALGSADAQLGLASATEWAERLDSDPFQRVSALNLRKIVQLEQGDAEGAERLRRQAEVLSLQLRTPSMFNTTLTLEIFAYAQCNHLLGLTQCIELLKPLAAQYPGWVPVLLNAEGSFQLVRGDYEAARSKFTACIELHARKQSGPTYAWALLAAKTGLSECLMGLGSYEDARTTASQALTESGTHASASFEIVRVLALAEGKLGDPQAAERLDALIAQQTALGTTGLLLGLSYEARARVAIWSGDAPAFERFSELTAREYRHGARTPLGARYERLMNEATRAGMRAKLTLADFQALASAGSSTLGSDELLTMVTRSMAGHRSADERTRTALQMICVAHGAREGYLFLLTQAGPNLRASHGAGTPPAELAERVQAFVTEKRRQAEDLDDMSTDALQRDPALEWTVRVDSGTYELLQLRCVIDAASMLAGVAVIEIAEGHTRNEQQAQLLQVLAASLLQAGDTQGVAL
ncbi:MAG TPA: serine/threonine-protein kinase [Polyangiales bacterium]|nr:serine/threonine-protein kinase [Polyangiales bacterium]